MNNRKAVYVDDVIDALEIYYADRYMVIVTIAELLEKLPPAQPERKKGEWVGADSQCGIGCPFCGTPVDDFCYSIDYIDLDYEPNFCPKCGAELR